MELLYFEDFRVGSVTHSSEAYRVTGEEIVEFASKWDPQDFHIDRDAAARSAFGGLTASGTHILAIRNWLIHRLASRAHVIAALGFDEVRFLRPVRPGDELRLQSEVIEARPSNSRPDRGLIRAVHTVINQNDETVLTLTVAILAKRRTPASLSTSDSDKKRTPA